MVLVETLKCLNDELSINNNPYFDSPTTAIKIRKMMVEDRQGIIINMTCLRVPFTEFLCKITG